ncbi:general amino-acid permease GAP1 [Coniochaeta sp. 2T2.1]|nr:general amino-acid permease GAP1 [Coniochaeta sp. 2T2.1]
MPYERDIEMDSIGPVKSKTAVLGSGFTVRERPIEAQRVPSGHFQATLHEFVDSFRPHSQTYTNSVPSSSHSNQGFRYYDLKGANAKTAHTSLSRELKGRHLQMIAIGGSIGTGLFVASGRTLNTGGPASVLLAYMFIGVMLYCTVQALGELAVIFPVAGSFSAFATRFLDPSWGFAMGWNYALQWLVVLPLEIIAAAMTIDYWDVTVNKAVFVTIFLFIIITINLFGAKAYGEAEFIFAIVKITAVIGFILLGIVINIGGTPTEGYIGGKYWSQPGAFHNGFKGFCSVFITAAFAFAGTELVGLAAAETANPRKSLPTAIKQVFWRISLFYIVALTLVGLLVPYDDPRLLGAQSSADASASPFVIAIESAGSTVLPGIMNGVILIAVISVGNSAVFGSSRTLAALADQGQAPKILGYIDKRGRPLVAILFASAIGLLAYMVESSVQGDLFDWLLAISGLSSLFTWGSICFAHIRFRQAWNERHRSLHDLAFRAQAGTIGSWIGLVANILILIAQMWVAISPVEIGDEKVSATERAKGFFLLCAALPIVLIFWLGHKLWFRTTFIRTADMDIDTGRRDFRLAVIKAREEEERLTWPRWKRIYRFLC